jgi:hypothetical protein
MGISISINLIPYFTYDFLSIIELLSPFKNESTKYLSTYFCLVLFLQFLIKIV